MGSAANRVGRRARAAAAGVAALAATALLVSPTAPAAASAPAGAVPAAGVGATGSIGDFVWLDEDRDGRQDPGEPGLRGVVVRLTDGDGQVLPLPGVSTNRAGAYRFDGLPPGEYGIALSNVRDREATVQGNGRPARDSDVDPRTLRSEPVEVAAGEVVDTVDAGFRPDFDLDLRMTAKPREVPPGARTTLRPVVLNTGRDDVAGRIRVIVPLPRELDLVAARGKGWGCREKQRADEAVCTYRRAVPGDGRSRPALVTARVRPGTPRGPVVASANLGGVDGNATPGSTSAFATVRVR